MERLQAAIEKAREQRENRAQAPVEGQPAAPAQERTGERAADQGPVSDTSSAAASAEEIEARWDALDELTLNRRRLQRARIVTLRAGATSAPFDVMRTRLMQQSRANGWRRIAIVSPHNSSGKTTTTANLAFSLSRHRDIRTMVLDMDLRRSGLTRLLLDKADNLRPICDFLEERVSFADVGYRYGRTLAYGLGFGAVPHIAELMQSDQTGRVLDALEAQYAPDFMIFDLPPLNIGDDNLGFLTRVDAALILAEAGRTTTSQIDVAERQVAELTNVMGIVLNKSRYSSGAYTHDEYY